MNGTQTPTSTHIPALPVVARIVRFAGCALTGLIAVFGAIGSFYRPGHFGAVPDGPSGCIVAGAPDPTPTLVLFILSGFAAVLLAGTRTTTSGFVAILVLGGVALVMSTEDGYAGSYGFVLATCLAMSATVAKCLEDLPQVIGQLTGRQ